MRGKYWTREEKRLQWDYTSKVDWPTISNVAFQPEEQLPMHMACSRPSGALEIVKTLMKASGKDGKLTSDKVSKKTEKVVLWRVQNEIYIECVDKVLIFSTILVTEI